MEQENKKRSIFSKLKSFTTQSKRVFKVTKKPTKEELKVTVKVTGIGILLIGVMGFIIHIAWKLLS
jgi:protein transport protein SEC61 subunit gamma and related proteins